MAGVPRNGRPGSIRGESARRGVTEHTIRKERAVAEGYSSVLAGGHGGGLRGAVQLEGRVIAPGGRVVTVEAHGPSQVARLGAYLEDRRQLLDGRMTPGQFRQRWAGKSIAGVRVSGSPERTVAAARRDASTREVRYRRTGRR